MILSCCYITSCGSDKDSLSGVYGCDDYQGYGMCYEFINSNSVVFYRSAHKGKYIGGQGMLSFTKQIGSSNWYYGDDPGINYTYTYDDNKVIIPMQGKILTKSGNSLKEDGSSRVYIK